MTKYENSIDVKFVKSCVIKKKMDKAIASAFELSRTFDDVLYLEKWKPEIFKKRNIILRWHIDEEKYQVAKTEAEVWSSVFLEIIANGKVLFNSNILPIDVYINVPKWIYRRIEAKTRIILKKEDYKYNKKAVERRHLRHQMKLG